MALIPAKGINLLLPRTRDNDPLLENQHSLKSYISSIPQTAEPESHSEATNSEPHHSPQRLDPAAGLQQFYSAPGGAADFVRGKAGLNAFKCTRSVYPISRNSWENQSDNSPISGRTLWTMDPILQ